MQLAEKLHRIGFRKVKENNFTIVSSWGGAEAQIRCAVRKDRAFGAKLVTLMIGIRFPEVEALLAEPDAEPNSPTIVTPVYSLHEDHRSQEWDAEAEGTAGALLEEVEKYALPFFDKYSNLDKLLLALQSDDPRKWFWLGPEGRLTTLAAMLVLRGERSSAIANLDKQIALKQESRTPPDIAIRFRLQKLRERLLNG